MKRPNEKKQDLLLDALSCIDEDILERGLALRDGAAAPAPKAAEPAPKTPRPATVMPPLYDLTRQPDKPPKKNPWRVLAVVAAACLLLCVVPLSMWMVGSMSKNEAGENAPIDGTHGNHAGIQNGTSVEDLIPGAPGDGWEENDAPEMEAPDAPMEEPVETGSPEDDLEEVTMPPWEEDTAVPEIIPSLPHTPKPWIWNTVSDRNAYIEKNTQLTLPGDPNRQIKYTYTAMIDYFMGTKDEMDAFMEETVSPEDALVLDLYAQYCMSLYTMDYGSHFLLFHPDVVAQKFTGEIQGILYSDALGRINALADQFIPYDTISIDLVLHENRLLSGEALDNYLADFANTEAEMGLSAEKITAVRYFAFTGAITVGHGFTPDDWGYDTEFSCYEYDGVWYLDDRYMDDDTSIDLAQSSLTQGEDYLETKDSFVTFSYVENGYLYTEEGDIFGVSEQLAKDLADNGTSAGDKILIQHYDIGVPIKIGNTGDRTLYRAIAIYDSRFLYQ